MKTHKGTLVEEMRFDFVNFSMKTVINEARNLFNIKNIMSKDLKNDTDIASKQTV